jgi:hypothetical protein
LETAVVAGFARAKSEGAGFAGLPQARRLCVLDALPVARERAPEGASPPDDAEAGAVLADDEDVAVVAATAGTGKLG